MTTITVGSRGSQLARTQAEGIIARLQSAHPGLNVTHQIVSTQGDRDRVTNLRALGATGVFTKDLEIALFKHEIDLAIHSLKDVPTALPDGMTLDAVPEREELRDALCGARLNDLKPGARVGTGSPRRQAQLLYLRPDLELVPLRGNVPTRLDRLTGEDRLDAVLLAGAGLNRLGLSHRIAELLPLEQFPPSPAQGALGLERRAEDGTLHELLTVLDDPAASLPVRAERALLNELHGGCSVPVGAYGILHQDILTLHAQVTALDGSRAVVLTLSGNVRHPDQTPERLGRELARQLKEAGASEIIGTLGR